MKSPFPSQVPPQSPQHEDEFAIEGDLGFLRDVIRLLPAGVTVQDEEGRFLLINDAAASQLGLAAEPPGELPAKRLNERREMALELLRAGRPAVAEVKGAGSRGKQVLLAAHRPARIAGRNLLLSCSADISEQKAVEDHLFRSAYFDELTGLPMRRVIEHRVQSLIQRHKPGSAFALAFLDIDNFKHINDYYGHSVGDALLVEVAKKLGLNLRENDMLSRISGDEFLLLLAPIDSEEEVAEYVEATLQRLKAPFFIDGSEIFASTSIGVSLFPDHGRSYGALLQNADIAMYRIKNDGKGAVAFFNSSMEREALARMKIEQSLRHAILEKRFCCAFQPKVDIRTKEIKGVEALVRLRDDDGVIQAPGTFINLAAELGLIDELTHLVLAEIVRSIDLINETFGASTTISINVAAKQADNPAFMRSFAEALEATGFPRRFMIEVTEDAFVTKTRFQDEIVPIFRKSRGRHIDRRFRHRLFVIVGAGRYHRRRDQDRSFLHQGHPSSSTQPGNSAGDQIAERGARHDHDRGRHRNLRGTGLSCRRPPAFVTRRAFTSPIPIFLEELKLAAPAASETRVNEASRPVQENRQAYPRPARYRR